MPLIVPQRNECCPKYHHPTPSRRTRKDTHIMPGILRNPRSSNPPSIHYDIRSRIFTAHKAEGAEKSFHVDVSILRVNSIGAAGCDTDIEGIWWRQICTVASLFVRVKMIDRKSWKHSPKEREDYTHSHGLCSVRVGAQYKKRKDTTLNLQIFWPSGVLHLRFHLKKQRLPSRRVK